MMRFNFTPFLILGVFFLSVPVTQLEFDSLLLFKLMPGDLGDARLNNYFLENVYQFLLGGGSLWHIGFFWPFPYVIGFSDNLFGSAPIYLIARFFSKQADTAFQIWFLVGYIFNYWAAYHALSKLGINPLPASVGATIFAFALPVTSHASHAQLHYRFAVPLALLYLLQFLEYRKLRLLTTSFAWLIWQFYCGIYIGFFTILLLIATVVGFIYKKGKSIRAVLCELVVDAKKSWDGFCKKQKFILAFQLTGMIFLLLLLFYPYIQVSKLYGITRGWSEISTMLPRLHSYLIADASWLWSQPTIKLLTATPMRHEHQMFPGLVCVGLLISAIFYGVRTSDAGGRSYSLMIFSLGALIILTLYVSGFSLWFLIYKLPLASAIRAVTRIDLVLLLPLAIIIAYFLHNLGQNKSWGNLFIWLFVLPILLIEFSFSSMNTSSKLEWRERLENKVKQVPVNADTQSILFFATKNEEVFYMAELDAMWTAMQLNRKTMNGYSGAQPQGLGYSGQYGNDCAIVTQRVKDYTDFVADKFNININQQEMKLRVLPIGFVGCN